MFDPVKLAQELIRCKSVTPDDGGAIELLSNQLTSLGFSCHKLDYSGDGSYPVKNLYAELGQGKANLCFAGHTDVVPVGDAAAWRFDPFGGVIQNGILYGRGAVDMKTAIACFISASARVLEKGKLPISLSLLITGDEEADAVNGTQKVLQWLQKQNKKITACIVGEPTCNQRFCDTIKNGRRGSINFKLTVRGKQGHVAYPENFANPITQLNRILFDLNQLQLDAGNSDFPPSNLEVTSIDVGNNATNIVPAIAQANINIRFNNIHYACSLEQLVNEVCAQHSSTYELNARCSGEAFLTPPGMLTNLVAESVEAVTGQRPALSTAGGISDARFIREFCPVVEVGVLNTTAHQVDEHVSLEYIEKLTKVYEEVITRFAAVHG